MRIDAKTETKACFALKESIGFEYTDKEVGSSMVKHINTDLDKGTCLIVGCKRANGAKTKIDAVNLAIVRAITGNSNGNEQEQLGHFQFLDKAKLEPYQTVYLVAHGIFRTRTIDNRSLSEIAELLVKAGFDGTQTLVSFACDLDKKGIDLRAKVMGAQHTNKTMAEELTDHLVKELEKVGKHVGRSSIKLKSYADGKTIVLNRKQPDDNGKDSERSNADLWIVNPVANVQLPLLAQKFLMYYSGFYKTVTIGQLAPGTEVNVSELGKDMNGMLNAMDRFKFSLIQHFLKSGLAGQCLLNGSFEPVTQLNTIEMFLLFVLGFTGLIWLAAGACPSMPFMCIISIFSILFLIETLIRAIRQWGLDGTGAYAKRSLFDPCLYLVAVLGLAFSGVANCAHPIQVFSGFIIINMLYALYKFLKTCYTMFS